MRWMSVDVAGRRELTLPAAVKSVGALMSGLSDTRARQAAEQWRIPPCLGQINTGIAARHMCDWSSVNVDVQ